MLFLRPVIIAMFFCVTLLVAPFSYLQADQTDIRLPALFEKLHATSDKVTAEAIADQIWAIWSEHGDDERLSQNLLLGMTTQLKWLPLEDVEADSSSLSLSRPSW